MFEIKGPKSTVHGHGCYRKQLMKKEINDWLPEWLE